jgi:hypothetical protein
MRSIRWEMMFGTRLADMQGAGTKIGCVAQHQNADVAQRGRRDCSPHICSDVVKLLAAVALTWSGCSASRAPVADSSAIPQTCSGGAICLGATAVYACRAGEVAELIDDCSAKGEVCSLARCTSSDCEMAENNTNSLVGCLFYTVQAENVDADQSAPTSFLVTNPGGDPAAVDLERPMPAGSGNAPQWQIETSLQVATGQSGRLVSDVGLVIPRGIGTTPLAAVRVSSDRPVTVVEIESDDTDQDATSTGGTMVLPLQSLGIDYRVVTYPQVATQAIVGTPGSRGGAGRMIVVGTQMATLIHFTPFGPVTASPADGFNGLAAGDDYQVTLDQGDVFQIYSGADNEDLTGGRVTTGQPIAVFSGNIATTYGSEVTGINSPDMAHEQMPPIATWSQTYVAAALTPEASIDCTSFFGSDGASIWRVLASANRTMITFDGPGAGTLQLLPALGAAEPLVQPLMLDQGEAASLIGAGSFTVTATSPILVTQGMDCEPSLSLAIAADAGALIQNLRFAVLPNFDQLLGVVRAQNAEVDLDGVALSDSMFQSAGTTFEVAEVSLLPCSPAQGVCTHHLTSTVGFGMTLRGMDVESSYALTAPALVGCDPVYEVCLN